ncbi:hypothetical protein EMCRGX_G011723 [Ephydatia muelleri]
MNSRPADILVQGWNRGKPAAFDVTVTSPLTPVSLNNASASVGAAAYAAECRKHAANDTRCQELGWLCIPLAVETYGNWEKEAQSVFSRLASLLSISKAIPKSKTLSEIYSRLNMSLGCSGCGLWTILSCDQSRRKLRKRPLSLGTPTPVSIYRKWDGYPTKFCTFSIVGSMLLFFRYKAADLTTVTLPSAQVSSQKALYNMLDNHLFNVLLGSLSIADRARLLSASSPHAYSWLTVIPSERQVALAAEQQKHNANNAKCTELVPLVVETYRYWRTEAKNGSSILSHQRYTKLAVK